MGLPWVRLDTAFPRNPKLLAIIGERDGYRAAFVWVCGLAYCGEQGTDGFVPRHALPILHGRPRDAALLVSHAMWISQSDFGWAYNDWAEFQQTTAETQERRENIERASRKGNCVRWHGPECGCWEYPP